MLQLFYLIDSVWAIGTDKTMNQQKIIELETGWEFMQSGVTKLKRILEGLPESQFSSEEYMMLYTYTLQYLQFTYTHNFFLLII